MRFLPILLCVFSFTHLKAQDKAPAKLDLSKFPVGQLVDKVVVPIPAEVFAVLDKVGEPDWNSGIVHMETDFRTQDRGLISLSFGSLVAEGFIAVQARSSNDIQKIGIRSLKIAEALGLKEAVQAHSKTVIEAAKDEEWGAVRSELDRTQQTVRDTMNRQRDKEMADLVSLGGWLRGTNILTGLIAEDYTSDKAELLNQPDLVRHFLSIVSKLNKPETTSQEMSEIEKGLTQLEKILTENDSFGIDVVNKMNNITGTMLTQFYFKKESK